MHVPLTHIITNSGAPKVTLVVTREHPVCQKKGVIRFGESVSKYRLADLKL